MQLNKSMETFDLRKLGNAQYNVHNKDSGELMTIRVIHSHLFYEVIRAHVLLLQNPDDPESQHAELLDMFTGFVNKPEDVTWYTTSTVQGAIEKGVMQAAKEGNSIVIIEFIPQIDPEGHNYDPRQVDK